MSVKMTVLGFVVTLGLGVIVLVSWDDDSLDPAVERALALPKRLTLESNLAYPLAGFTVARDQDPAAEGYAAVTRVNELLHPQVDGTAAELPLKIQNAWTDEVLTIDDPTKIICATKDDGCIAALWARRTDLLTLAERHQTLITRYGELANYSDYQMDLRPHPQMPLPRFSTVLSTHRLVLGTHAIRYLEGEDAALGEVLWDLHFLRRLLGQAGNVLTKMVATAMIADTLHVYAALMDRETSNMQDFPTVARLSNAEVSVESALMGEFRFVASALSGFRGEAGNFQDLGLPPWLASAGLRPLFKPNRTLNSDFLCWQSTLAIARLPAQELIENRPAKDAPACKPSWYEWLLNPIGRCSARSPAPISAAMLAGCTIPRALSPWSI